MPDILKQRTKEIAEAKRQILEGKTVIWNTRLESMLAIGNMRGVLDLAGKSVEDTINNCGCNVQCGAAQNIGQLTNPIRG